MNRAWYLFYGRKLGMSRQEIMATKIGEMRDMISCLAIYEGTALPARPHVRDVMTALEMR